MFLLEEWVHSWGEFHQLIKSVTEWDNYRKFMSAKGFLYSAGNWVFFVDLFIGNFMLDFVLFMFSFIMFYNFRVGITSIMTFYQLKKAYF